MLFPAGFVTWDRDTRTVELLFVQEQYRRKGIARRLWQTAAHVEYGGLQHSRERSPLGTKFARAVGGGPVPPNTRPLTAQAAHAMGSRMMAYLSSLGSEAVLAG